MRYDLYGGPTLMISSCTRIFDEPIDGVWAAAAAGRHGGTTPTGSGAAERTTKEHPPCGMIVPDLTDAEWVIVLEPSYR